MGIGGKKMDDEKKKVIKKFRLCIQKNDRRLKNF